MELQIGATAKFFCKINYFGANLVIFGRNLGKIKAKFGQK